MTAIQMENLRKEYGQVKALDGLTLTVEPGTVFGFLGPNGAGKSTTIRLLTGLARPTSGQGWVADVEIGNQRALAQKIGYLPEEPAFYPWMSPAEFLDHIGRTFSMAPPERKQRVDELLEMVGLSAVRKRRIAGFSRGMRQRLGLAQALVNRPEVLLLDEPASALDPAGRKEVLNMISQLRGNCTVFMSTHILADVERVCDTIGIIDHGKLIVEARQSELLERYTIPAFELESDPGSEEKFGSWADSLTDLDWVSSVAHNGASARVVVKDLEVARRALLPYVVQSGIILRRYEVVTPSLEDIFLRLVGEDQNL
jgi:ABC-2 type transport system ATP-binding protein